MMMGYSQKRRYLINGGFISLLVIFTTSFIWSFYLQKENNLNIDRFYRSTNWYTHTMVIQSNLFLHQFHLHQLNGVDMDEFDQSYNLLWSNLDTFLHTDETMYLREKHPIIEEDVEQLFSIIKDMDDDFENKENLDTPAFKIKIDNYKTELKQLRLDISQVVSGQISQGIRSNNDLIQLWQISMFIISLLLAVALLRSTQKSYQQARLDTLTQLGNRRVLNEYLDKCLKQKHRKFMVIALDLKHFKFINDTIGYHVGDEVLLNFAQRINKPKNAAAFRLGGDEFVLVVDISKIHESPLEWVKNQKKNFEFDLETLGHNVEVRCRLGIALHNNTLSSKQILEQAIFAMNETKQQPNSDIVLNTP